MIPKIIHYCWLSNDPYPSDIAKYQESWKKYLPDYEFVLWDANRFDINSSLWVRQAFEAKKYAFAADYIRLYALYNYGGIYMDMDIEVLRPFDENLLDSEILAGYENDTTKLIEAGFLGAEKSNAFIGECLKHYQDRPFVKTNGEYDMLVLPRIITPVYKKYYNQIPFSFDYFTVKSWETGEIKITENSYTIHHFAGSWGSAADKYLAKEFGPKIMAKKYPFLVKKLIIWFYCLYYRLKKNGIKQTYFYYKIMFKSFKKDVFIWKLKYLFNQN